MLPSSWGRSKVLMRRGQRSLWTSVTVNGSSMSNVLKKLELRTKPEVCVALVSNDFAATDYRAMLTRMQGFQPKYLLGCVVDRVVGGQGVSVWAGYDMSVAGFRVEDSVGRPKVRSTAVGRWSRVQGRNYIDEVGWDAFGSVSRPAQTYELPIGLKEHSNNAPSLVFLASDHEPDHLLQALDHHYPAATVCGVVGAATPFITGHPYTLHYQGEAMGAGIVGFAAYDTSKTTLRIEHDALTTLGKPVVITRCRGNIILDLDEQGATGLLLSLIQSGQSAALSKDHEFYLGIYPPGQSHLDPESMSVARVVSGDPSRGNMAVDTTIDLQVGQTVQFMQKGDTIKDILENCKEGQVTLAVDTQPESKRESCQSQEPRIRTGIFGATSDNGVIAGRPGQASQLLQVPYSKIVLSS